MGLYNQLAIVFFFVLLITAWALTVAALALPSWVTSDTLEIGLFKVCLTSPSTSCSKISSQVHFKYFWLDPLRIVRLSSWPAVFIQDVENKTWLAAGALLIIGLIFLGITIILAIASLCTYRFIRPSKFFMGIADVFIVVGTIVVPIGYNVLGDDCGSAGVNSCGLTCSNGSNDFGYFSLCDPWEVGQAMYLLIAAVIILFIASLTASCVRSKTPTYEA
eukprot:m.109627 g.109627  ORF g.109627 m.109627 type:complete len:219 (+) comp51776_c0_seq6:317-973(+)